MFEQGLAVDLLHLLNHRVYHVPVDWLIVLSSLSDDIAHGLDQDARRPMTSDHHGNRRQYEHDTK